jgi:hypothetical protein
MKIGRLFSLLVLFGLFLALGCATAATGKGPPIQVKKENFNYQGEKITVGEIEGYHEAVAMLKSSLLNALMGKYTEDPEKSTYRITGSVYAKRHWRKKTYIYRSIALRVMDKNGNIVMSIANERPVLQSELNAFSNDIVDLLR